MNEHDSERIAGLLEADGYVAAKGEAQADVVVLNTCCIRENADNRLYGQLGHLAETKRQNPKMKIMVAGCLAQKDQGVVREKAPWVDVVFGTHNVHRAVDLLNESVLSGPVTEIADEPDEFPSALPVRRDVAYAAWVTIQIGCDNNCAFCIVPSVRGKEISKPFGEILREVRDLAAQGVVEVNLLGQNVNSYGRDIAMDLRGANSRDVDRAGAMWCGDETLRLRSLFPDLLREVGAIDGIERVRYVSPHPKDMRDDTFAAMAETPSVCEHLHYPLQSGSDRVLAAMHRGYTAGRYLEKLASARKTIDDLSVTTDIIIGFPGETEDDFVQTLEVCAEAQFDGVFTFLYSPRSGTEAAEWVDQFVSPAVMSERYARVDAVVQRSALQTHLARIGRVENVLVEGPSRKNPMITTGRTRQNKTIHFDAGSQIIATKPGAFVTVEVTSAKRHHLMGELREIVAAPRHRVRIPLLVI